MALKRIKLETIANLTDTPATGGADSMYNGGANCTWSLFCATNDLHCKLNSWNQGPCTRTMRYCANTGPGGGV